MIPTEIAEKNHPTFAWVGSKDSVDGIATYTLNEEAITINMLNFTLADSLYRHIEYAFIKGVMAGKQCVKESVVRHMEKIQ